MVRRLTATTGGAAGAGGSGVIVAGVSIVVLMAFSPVSGRCVHRTDAREQEEGALATRRRDLRPLGDGQVLRVPSLPRKAQGLDPARFDRVTIGVRTPTE